MAGLKELNSRIKSVQSTGQLSAAMKMVAASKLRKSQNSLKNLRSFAMESADLFRNIYASYEHEDFKFFFVDKPCIKKLLLVVITSDKGLCGAFNANTIKSTLNLIQGEYAELSQNGKLELLCLGKKALDFFSRGNYLIHPASYQFSFEGLNYNSIRDLALNIVNAYENNIYDRVELIYQRPVNAATQKLHIQRFLPITKPAQKQETRNNELLVNKNFPDSIFLPEKREVIIAFIPKLLKIHFYYSLLESQTAEHGARMTAMHKASDNANQLLKVLNLNYNKLRQSAITNELLEIVNGAEALNK